MTDLFTRKKRSAVMSALRSQGNAATELRLIALFRAYGITGWRRGATLRSPVSPGSARSFRVKPDFVFRPHRLAVFVDGSFWPGCPPRHVAENPRRLLAGENRHQPHP
jgi:DNA mismatch endonuclease (patch repair protein)